MHDQADQLRKLVRTSVQADATLAPGGPIIAVSGGQPSVGATTVAVQIARELARLGKQVVLIDANVQRPAAAKHFADPPTTSTQNNSSDASNSSDQAWSGLPQAMKPAHHHIPASHQHAPTFHNTLTEVLSGKRRAVEVLTEVDEGVRLLAGCRPHTAPPLDRDAMDHFTNELSALSRQVDVVLLDAGSGMNPWIDRLWQLAHQVLLVSTPGHAAFLDSYAAVKLSQFPRHDGKLRLVVNRADDESVLRPLANRFDETCRKFLFIAPKPAAALPAFHRRQDATAGSSSRATQGQGSSRDAYSAPDEPFQRSVRLLAADLANDFRVAALRLVRPNQTLAANQLRRIDREDFSQRR